MRLRPVALLILCACLLLFGLPYASAEETTDRAAEDISGMDILTDSEGFPQPAKLFDGRLLEGKATPGDASLTLEYEQGIGSLYFIFDDPYGGYTVTNNDTGESRTVGEQEFLHDFVDLQTLFETTPTSVTVDFSNGPVTIFELRVYTPGQVPDEVQKWQIPADGKTDLVLFSTHGDDEQLFFAGVLPYYAGELGYRVQVVYMTDHREDDPHRIHEMLNGLWAVGVTAYPVTQPCPDFILKNDMEGTYARLEQRGYPREKLMDYVVEQIRRFKPLVAVGHDINGEYGHGMHMVYTDLLMEAVTLANDPESYPESAETYGVWDTPKTYLHLYEENEIVMDWDRPLDRFDGMTAFEVTQQIGFPCHASQYQDFAWYHLYYETAAEVKKYNPCYYGLFRTTVGEDVEKNDFFENLTVYAEQERIAEEARLEAERLAAEEEARRQEEEARQAELERQREEASRATAEPTAGEQPEMPQLAQDEHEQTRRDRIILLTIADVVLVILMFVILFIRKKRNQYHG